jgi:hypothetical protein
MNKFPITIPTDFEANLDYEQLKLFDTTSLIKEGKWFSRSEFDISKQKSIYIDQNKTGLKASDRHHWYARMACDSLTSPSPIRSWYQKKHRATLENSKFFEANPKTALALRKYIASQFRPTAALAIYSMFNARRVYDPCGGWGDRLVAAMAMGIDYHCRDTNPLVIAADAAMQQSYETSGNISFEYAQSEIDSPEGEFDLVFTSPPYWKAEKYKGNLSSHQLYKKFDDWLENFLFQMLDNSFAVLSNDGHLVINISDMYGNHTYNRIVQPILDKFKDYETYVIGYRMAKRVNSKSNDIGIFCEPIIVVKK